MYKSDSSAVQALLRFRVDTDAKSVSKEHAKWAEKAVKLFVKRHAKTQQQIKDLQTVLETKEPRSNCVTMPLSAFDSAAAALVYLQIWRFPNLQDVNELFGEPFCKFKMTHVTGAEPNGELCINPYHYKLIGGGQKTMSVSAPVGNRRRDGNSGSAMSVTPSDRSANVESAGLALSGAFNVMRESETSLSTTFANSKPVNVELRSASSANDGQLFAAPHTYSGGSSSNGFAVPTAYSSGSANGNVGVKMDDDVAMDSDAGVKREASVSSPAFSFAAQPAANCFADSQQLATTAAFDGDVLPENDVLYSDVLYVEPSCWCSVQYYEKQHLGEVFHCTSPTLIIDGFCDPSSPRRFCLGRISNPNREPEAEHIRRQIQHGVKLYYVAGEVYLENRSENYVFVQSSNMNVRNGWPPYAVCKVGCGETAQLFANYDFAALLSRSVNEGYESVRRLLDMCSIRMSFVKGWGTQYRSQSLNSVPCWVEICLNGPLQWLDRVLRQMHPDVGKATSIS